jgi:hypothetical protein
MSERQLHLFRGRRQRGEVLPAPPEFALQCMVADSLRKWASDGWLWFHYPSGEKRNAITGARLKRAGVARGISDFLLLPPDGAPEPHCHCLELKRRGGRLSDHQIAFGLWCKANSYPFNVAYSYEEAISVLKRWGALKMGVQVQ